MSNNNNNIANSSDWFYVIINKLKYANINYNKISNQNVLYLNNYHKNQHLEYI